MFGLNVWVTVRGGRARLPRLGVRWQRYSPLCGVASGDVWHQMLTPRQETPSRGVGLRRLRGAVGIRQRVQKDLEYK